MNTDMLKRLKLGKYKQHVLRFIKAFIVTFTKTMGKVNAQNTVNLRKLLTSSEISD